MNNVEFIISQYADDTPIILDGSESSLNQTILERFSRILGLHVDSEKTQLVWIGSEKYRTNSIKIKWRLSWGKSSFKVYGITFNIDLEKND